MPESFDPLRREIAAAAAQLIADGGLDYASAKRKAARQVLGEGASPRGSLPDNELIDSALLEHLSLFDDGHAERVTRRREVAVELMGRLGAFSPYLTGAVWKGIVAEHAPIHLQLFHDDPKEVEIHLLNGGVQFDVDTTPHFRNRNEAEVEVILFWWRDEPVMVSLYGGDDLRGALRGGALGAERGNLAALQQKMSNDNHLIAQAGASR